MIGSYAHGLHEILSHPSLPIFPVFAGVFFGRFVGPGNLMTFFGFSRDIWAAAPMIQAAYISVVVHVPTVDG